MNALRIDAINKPGYAAAVFALCWLHYLDICVQKRRLAAPNNPVRNHMQKVNIYGLVESFLSPCWAQKRPATAYRPSVLLALEPEASA